VRNGCFETGGRLSPTVPACERFQPPFWVVCRPPGPDGVGWCGIHFATTVIGSIGAALTPAACGLARDSHIAQPPLCD